MSIEDVEFLHKLLAYKNITFNLFYRGSIDGWMAKDFHSFCDGEGPTLTLMQIKDGHCIGGFTNAQWSSPEEWECKSDAVAILFNLTTHTSFPCKDSSRAIRCWKDRGPQFGYFRELAAFNEPFNEEGACVSRTNEDVYNIPRNSEGINMLTNKMSDDYDFTLDRCKFTITEIEVWGVYFNE